MKNTTIYGIGALVIIAGAGFLYFKNKKATSLLETALPGNAGISTTATTAPIKAPLASTINPSAPLTALDLNIAALPGTTTLAEIQPLIQQQQIANAQAEIEKQHQAEELAKQIQQATFLLRTCENPPYTTYGHLFPKNCTSQRSKLSDLTSKINALGYKAVGNLAVKL